MATAHMQRPYPPIYHPPQSAPVASQPHDSRPLYQPPLAHNMYYPQYPLASMHQPYLAQPPPQQQPQQQQQPPLMMHHQHQPQHQQHQQQHHQQPPPPPPPQQHHQQPPQQQTTPILESPRMKIESRHATSPTSSGAAPGPIPATTPLVVRQDTNGVQWIAFEYSRDRVKMEYTIRCDVENINIETLSQDFKTENCVYPRACCSKDQYRGNRLVYETECNAVGWALAELNPCLRGKRGLIQRAVDSWRNSHQDPRLRSRRVKRMAKANNRKHAPSQAAAGAGGGGGGGGMQGQGQGPAQPQQSLPGLHEGEDVDRPAHVFHSPSTYPYPPASASTTASAPLGGGGGGGGAADYKLKRDDDLPEAKRRKFILVEDPQRACRVRVKVMLDQVDMNEIPDSYRRANSVFPRSYVPVHSPFGPTRRRSDRFEVDADDESAPAGKAVAGRDDEQAVVAGRTLVAAPLLEGGEKVALPRLTRGKRDREALLNDMGYRMSWGQSRVFAGRTLFLQRSMDAYRNKMRNSMLTAGHEAGEIAPYFETRAGKRRWLERKRAARRADAEVE